MLRQADVLLVHFMQRLFRSLNKSDFAYITLKSHLWRHFDWKAESGVWMHTTCTLIPPCSVQQRTKWPAEESQACGEKNRCNTPKRKKKEDLVIFMSTELLFHFFSKLLSQHKGRHAERGIH